MQRGKFITIEGSEGAGKSTALQFIQRYFQEKQIDLIITREPGGTDIAESIRQLLLHANSAEKMQADTELLLMFAARVQHIQHYILPALQAGKWVISDRYVDASYAYQGGGRELAMEKIAALDKLFVNEVQPDLTLLLDIPVDLGFARAEKRGNGKDRIEQEKIDFFERVRNVYLARAQSDPKRINIIDASQDLPAVQMQIQSALNEFMSKLS